MSSVDDSEEYSSDHEDESETNTEEEEEEDDEEEILKDERKEIKQKMLDKALAAAMENMKKPPVDPNITRVTTVCDWFKSITH